MAVSVVIATYNNPEGLYLSVFAALQQLENSGQEFEIVIAADAGTPIKWEQAHPNIRCIRLTGNSRTGSPQGTRDAGIRAAQYKNVLCIDSHVIVSDIAALASAHETLGGALTFPSMAGGSAEMWKLYGSVFDWDSSFWYKHVIYKPKQNAPYRILETSHSGFVVDRDWYIKTGGYTNLLSGYGGEETQLGLKAWMTGRENWLVPEVWHAHYQPAGRNEGAEHTDNYKRNFMICSYVFGGQEYLQKTEAFYRAKLKITPEIEKERQYICSFPLNGNLDFLRFYLDREGIQ